MEPVCFGSVSETDFWPKSFCPAENRIHSGQETQRLLVLPARRDQEAAGSEVALIGRDQCRCRKAAARVAASGRCPGTSLLLPEPRSLRWEATRTPSLLL